MKKNIILIIILFPLFVFGQNLTSYDDVSGKIFKTLNNSKLKDIDFGNKTNGIERHYRKINNKWILAWITLWKDGQFIWSCKPHGYDYDFSGDLFNFNKEMIMENTELVIPYETGKVWLKVIIKNFKINSIMTYYSIGQQKEILNQKEGFYKMFYKNGKIKIIKEGTFGYSYNLRNGTEKKFNEEGEVIEINKIELSKRIQ